MSGIDGLTAEGSSSRWFGVAAAAAKGKPIFSYQCRSSVCVFGQSRNKHTPAVESRVAQSRGDIMLALLCLCLRLVSSVKGRQGYKQLSELNDDSSGNRSAPQCMHVACRLDL